MIYHNKYRPIYQLPYCCVPATLQWIFYRHGLDILDQESIGVELGLRLPEKGRSMFRHKNIIFLKNQPKDGFGTQIEKKKYSINSFFRKHKIPLEISDIYIPKTQKDLEKFIIANFKKQNDIILRFNPRAINKDKKSYGHLALITAFDTRTKKITIGDPTPPFFKKATLDQVMHSMSDKIDGTTRGLFIIR